MDNINVRETVNVSGGFITGQGADHSAAYQRAVFTRDMLIKYKTDINSTNTVDVNGRLRQLYEDLDFIAKEIIKEEIRRAEQAITIF